MAAKEFPASNLDNNRDPITGTPGAHPVGTGVGAAGGAVAGAAAGSVAGPVGTVVGLVAGGLAGGLGGKAVAESVNPTAEDAYWRSSYDRESYYEPGRSYDDYAPAYRYGTTMARTDQYRGRPWNDVESNLRTDWEARYSDTGSTWDKMKAAVRHGWERMTS